MTNIYKSEDEDTTIVANTDKQTNKHITHQSENPLVQNHTQEANEYS